MSTSRWLRMVALALVVAGTIALPAPRERAGAQPSGLYVNAVDLDIVPAERDKYLAAIKENGAAAIHEPGCRQFDILVLASDPNHFFLYEVYDNEAAYQAHRQTEHFKKYAALTANMVGKRNARPMTPIELHAKGH
ncbi:MAG TPA: putative quinol monooxygenase [Candidatus Bathyarchaeia archaeon]|nr:putative quinol monooxygenase [Candidatus Bathyarchaeia archaeon]